MYGMYLLNETVLTYVWKHDAGLRLPSAGRGRYDVRPTVTNQRHISEDCRSEKLKTSVITRIENSLQNAENLKSLLYDNDRRAAILIKF
jgi:hypothetical protein